MALPMTFIVTIALIMGVVIGVVIIYRALGPGGRSRRDLELGTQSSCPHCKLLNPTHANYCGHCGKSLQ